MSSQFSLREMQPADGPALTRLMEDDPETPGMSATTRFIVDAYQAWAILKPGLIGVVAEAPGVAGLVGAATVAFQDIQFDGRVLPSAFLENLKVHHAYRGRGLGTALAQWRIQRASEHFGGDGVIMTGTASDNTASLATVKKWGKQFLDPIQVAVRPMRANPPTPRAGVSIRAAEAHDLAEIVDKANHFYANYNLYPPLSTDDLDSILKITPAVFYYRTAVDSSGNIVAGMMLCERGQLMVDEFRNVSLPLRFLNAVAHIIPPDNRIRLLETVFIWFDQLDAARHLWEHVRWEFREKASTISGTFDPRSPLKDVFQLKPWHVPKPEVMMAINGPTIMDTKRLVSSALRG